MEQVKRTFEKAYRANSQAHGNSQDAKNTATNGGVEYQIVHKTYSDADIAENAKVIAKMDAVSEIPAEKLKKSGKNQANYMRKRLKIGGTTYLLKNLVM